MGDQSSTLNAAEQARVVSSKRCRWSPEAHTIASKNPLLSNRPCLKQVFCDPPPPVFEIKFETTIKDETYINVHIPIDEKPHFRSAEDECVLRDVVHRANGLEIPKGYYYLCDNGYAISEGFLTLYKSFRYRLKE
ncbi:hypothetical protein AAHA92_22399 [Salvia divinorum]|uniref:DDE Tnp4 domain-containing protein n=1 Tax=Salvia divinorum TaxID=28513 RepID=A0ABD1GNK3_SALDI